MKLQDIRRDWPVFPGEGMVAIGAVRDILKDHITVYIEGFGDHRIEPHQIASVHDTKVVLNPDKLPEDVSEAIARAHDSEDPVNRDHRPLP